MENEDYIEKNYDGQYPEYIENQPLKVRKLWEEWKNVSDAIENHADRFVTLMNPKTNQTKIFDLRNLPGLLKLHLTKFGATEEEIKSVLAKREKTISKLQRRKAALSRQWSKESIGKNAGGDKTVLSLKYAEILEMFGSYHSQNEVVKAIRTWGFSVNPDRLREFQIDNKDKIKAKKLEYLTKKNDFKLATETGRLEVLSKLANENMDKFDKTKGLGYSKEVRALLEQIRKEVKGEEIRLTIDGKIDINATLAANKTMNEVFSQLPINMMVIGLTAAKVGINPGLLMGQLAKSYYSKWNGFAKLEDKSALELPGKFIKNYDWNAIKQMNETKADDNVEDVEYEEVFKDNIERIEFSQNKSSLLDMLNDYKKQLNK